MFGVPESLQNSSAGIHFPTTQKQLGTSSDDEDVYGDDDDYDGDAENHMASYMVSFS